MKPMRRLSRRSFLGRVAGGVAGGALLMVTGNAAAQERTGLNDEDPVDPAGNGRGARTPGCTDADTGANADQANRGRGNGVTDRDTGSYADPPRCGRGAPRS